MWLVDTNVVSYIYNQNELGRRYARKMGARALAISWMTRGELLEGALRAGWSEADIEQYLTHLDEFYVLLGMDREIFDLWASIRAARWQQPIATDDALIAATARRYGLPLVTHNPDDFADTGVRIVTLLAA